MSIKGEGIDIKVDATEFLGLWGAFLTPSGKVSFSSFKTPETYMPSIIGPVITTILTSVLNMLVVPIADDPVEAYLL